MLRDIRLFQINGSLEKRHAGAYVKPGARRLDIDTDSITFIGQGKKRQTWACRLQGTPAR